MKRISRLFKAIPKWLFSITAFGLILLLPASTLAQGTVKLEGSIGVANVTAGDTQYQHSVNASYDQVVKFQVFYHNTEPANSGLVAQNLRVKISFPTGESNTQIVGTTISADNSVNTITDHATVNINRSDATLDYISGSAVWRHDIGTNAHPNWVEQKVSDNIVTSSQGLVLENEQPCFNFAATVTVLARVHVSSVSITKKVRENGTGQAVTSLQANPGDRLQYLLTAVNMGNTNLTSVTLRDTLPAGLTFVPGTVTVFDGAHPNGVVINNDSLFNGGVDIGTLGVGANVFIVYEADVVQPAQLPCGETTITNTAVVTTEQTGPFNNTATVTTNKVCQSTPPSTPATTTTSSTPTQLANTGPGDVVGIFGVTTVLGAVAHRLFSRRFARG